MTRVPREDPANRRPQAFGAEPGEGSGAESNAFVFPDGEPLPEPFPEPTEPGEAADIPPEPEEFFHPDGADDPEDFRGTPESVSPFDSASSVGPANDSPDFGSESPLTLGEREAEVEVFPEEVGEDVGEDVGAEVGAEVAEDFKEPFGTDPAEAFPTAEFPREDFPPAEPAAETEDPPFVSGVGSREFPEDDYEKKFLDDTESLAAHLDRLTRELDETLRSPGAKKSSPRESAEKGELAGPRELGPPFSDEDDEEDLNAILDRRLRELNADDRKPSPHRPGKTPGVPRVPKTPLGKTTPPAADKVMLLTEKVNGAGRGTAPKPAGSGLMEQLERLEAVAAENRKFLESSRDRRAPVPARDVPAKDAQARIAPFRPEPAPPAPKKPRGRPRLRERRPDENRPAPSPKTEPALKAPGPSRESFGFVPETPETRFPETPSPRGHSKAAATAVEREVERVSDLTPKEFSRLLEKAVKRGVRKALRKK
jgi:hypothetical protein